MLLRCGPLIDLCRGPHVKNTGKIKAFSVTKVSQFLMFSEFSLNIVLAENTLADIGTLQCHFQLKDWVSKDCRLSDKQGRLFLKKI